MGEDSKKEGSFYILIFDGVLNQRSDGDVLIREPFQSDVGTQKTLKWIRKISPQALLLSHLDQNIQALSEYASASNG